MSQGTLAPAKTKTAGNLFALIGGVVMAGGLGGVYMAHGQIAAAGSELVPAQMPSGFLLYAVLAALVLVTTLILFASGKSADLEPKMEMKESYKIFLLFLPVLALAFVFSYLPLWGWRYAFFDYKAGGELTAEKFVGFKWFTYGRAGIYHQRAHQGDRQPCGRHLLLQG